MKTRDFFTISAIGCAAFLLWERLNDHLPGQPGASVELGWNELTRSLGLTPGRGAKVLARLVDFHLVKQVPAEGWFAVRSAAPTLKPAQLERLAAHCPQLAASHDTFAAATAAWSFARVKSRADPADAVPARCRVLLECVAERPDDASSVTLDLWRSCISNGPPSWTPSVKPTELELCSCVPGEKHTLCIRYR